VSVPLLHRDLGLTDDELDEITRRLGRDPTPTELAMFSVMWSEHCSYKSSRKHLGKLPTRSARVLLGPGEGAGVVEVVPGVAVAWKIESHNHPSFVEPASGAATGVGGIVRDVLSVGARPIALLDSLRFGPLHDARSRHLADGVVSGISSYANSIGVPTVGGEAAFEPPYAANPLVNVACLGVIEAGLVRAAAEGPGNRVVLYGAATGRDGIGGASVLASADLDGTSAAKRPSVQIGDPFSEKLLIEASLELMRRGLVVALQDLGAGGISCAASEMAAKAATGMRIDARAVPPREPDMEPSEIIISESQERMLAVVEPRHLEEALAVCAAWGLRAATIGEVITGGRVEVVAGAEHVADVAAADLAIGPLPDRPAARPEWLDALQAAEPGSGAPQDLGAAWLAVLSSPTIASKRWVWDQYDHMVLLGTAAGPGGDAAVVRLPGRDEAVALSVDGPGRLCLLDPYDGARHAVAEAARNVAVTGAEPIAVTNCLNLGNPERPEVMWQLTELVRGLADACSALGTPVTGGNVSFYNETAGRSIHPTPVIGMLGILSSAASAVPSRLRDGDAIVLLGELDTDGFGGSEYAVAVHGVVAGRPPGLDLERERRLHGVLAEGARRGLLRAAHDVSAGGLAVCLAESAIAGGVGVRVTLPGGGDHRELFSESPGVALVACKASDVGGLITLARAGGVPAAALGSAGGTELDLGVVSISLEEAARAYEEALPAHLSVTFRDGRAARVG
jgi:phosphoribosylformylglycinamidine synthase II